MLGASGQFDEFLHLEFMYIYIFYALEHARDERADEGINDSYCKMLPFLRNLNLVRNYEVSFVNVGTNDYVIQTRLFLY